MDSLVDVLVPVLDRPQRVQPLLDSLAAASKFISCRALFLVSPDDERELAEIRRAGATALGVEWGPGQGDYARKINYGARRSRAEFLFLAADDVAFRPGWIERCLAVYQETGACVIGTNDLGNQRVVSGRHSTHTLVHRDYLACGTVDTPGRLLHDGYHHNFVDDEFVQTAISRGVFVPVAEAVVEHLHPDWKKGEPDAVYQLGKRHFNDDRALYNERAHLWGGPER